VGVNFDLTSPLWASEGVTDEASFVNWLGNVGFSNLSSISVSDFSFVENTIQCNMTAIGTYFDLKELGISSADKIGIITGLQYLDLSNNQIVTFNPSIALPTSLIYLDLSNNQIVTFNPSIALPNSLQQLILNFNQIVTFDTSIALPSSLENLFLKNNQLATFNPSLALPNSLQQLDLENNQIVTFNPSIALPSSLFALDLSNNQIVTFNPSIALPMGLQNLDLSNNQMTTASYTTMEIWASGLASFSNSCYVSFNSNINSVTGTDLKAILETKNCIVTI
jgi:Leucine-rich repeat (LRR) protein